MIHRYGRHGNKAWLRWRKKRLRRTSLIPTPQIVVLNVPLDFLRRIRKVTILMEDGQEKIFEPNGEQSSPDAVEANTDKIRAIAQDGTQRAREALLSAAEAAAVIQAESAFRDLINPYQAKPDLKRAEGALILTFSMYKGMVGWSLNDVRKDFYDEFVTKHSDAISNLSNGTGANSPALQKLLVLARTDKISDRREPSPYSDYRPTLRAYENLALEVGRDIDKILPNLKDRIDMFQKFYKEYEPEKEED